jgi:hypothetical protein
MLRCDRFESSQESYRGEERGGAEIHRAPGPARDID